MGKTSKAAAASRKTEEEEEEEEEQEVEQNASTTILAVAGTAGKKSGKRVSKKNKVGVFSSYARRVLRQVHPTLGIQNRTMRILNDFLVNMAQRFANETRALVEKTGKGSNKTFQARDIEHVIRLVLPGELAKHAIAEGRKALAKFNDANTKAAAAAAATK